MWRCLLEDLACAFWPKYTLQKVFFGGLIRSISSSLDGPRVFDRQTTYNSDWCERGGGEAPSVGIRLVSCLEVIYHMKFYHMMWWCIMPTLHFSLTLFFLHATDRLDNTVKVSQSSISFRRDYRRVGGGVEKERKQLTSKGNRN